MRLKALAASVRTALRAGLDQYRFLTAEKRARDRAAPLRVDLPVDGEYLISSDRGLFVLSHDSLRSVLSGLPVFGLALSDDGADVYLATWTDTFSSVLVGRAAALIDDRERFELRELHRMTTAHSSRIHQICVLGDSLWLANTNRNALTRLDRRTGRWLADIAPFKDRYGLPITVNQNHLNSVLALPGLLLFTAFKAGREGVIGIVGRGRILLFTHKNMGIHDIVLTGDDVYFCDSYSFSEAGGCGNVIKNGVALDPGRFREPRSQFVRGVAGIGNELLVGNSAVGAREERFSGGGSLLRLHDGSVTHRVEIPCSQIYMILLKDGRRFAAPPRDSSFEATASLLTSQLGPAIEEIPLAEALVSERGKKFDERDIGDVADLA